MAVAAPNIFSSSTQIEREQLLRLAQEPRLTTKTITDLGRARQTSAVLRLLVELTQMRGEVNIFHYNAALSAFASASAWQRAFRTLFLLCRRRIADKTSFSASITACSPERWPMALSLISRIPWASLECDVVALGAAVACGVPWPGASELLGYLQAKEVQANVVVCSALLASCETAGAWRSVMHRLLCMQLIGVQPNVVTYSTTSRSYTTAMLWRSAGQALSTFLREPCRSNRGGSTTVVCNSALSGLTSAKSRQWLKVFNILQDMTCYTIEASRVTFSLALACCQVGQWRRGVSTLEHMHLHNVHQNEFGACLAIQSLASSSSQGSAWRSVIAFLRNMELAAIGLDRFSFNAVLSVLRLRSGDTAGRCASRHVLHGHWRCCSSAASCLRGFSLMK
ncbi:unnamed protein product [Symbiodinium natans]|uniref:Pentatricopeptide repeat-containing protein, chloroplastic n=1 Tax=Symbiodinium natans TaxID=878477 RepID=A0A812M488_9DINO|nr:unnamed protein product [Symbiodinium natans]